MQMFPTIGPKRIAAIAAILIALALALWPERPLTRDVAKRMADDRFHIVCKRECASFGLNESMLNGPTDSPINFENKEDFEFSWKSKDDVRLNIWFAKSWPGVDSGHSWRRGNEFLSPVIQKQ